MLATGGLPISGSSAAAASTTSVNATTGALQTSLGGVSAGLLSATPATSRATPLSAPMTATVTFEPSAFRAVPRRVVTPAKVAPEVRVVRNHRTPPASTQRDAAPAPAVNKQAPPKPVAAPKATKHVAAPTKATKHVEAPSKVSKHVEAPAKKSKHVEVPSKESKHLKAPSKGTIHLAPPKRSKHAAPPKQVKHAPPKKPHVKKPVVKKPVKHSAGAVRGSSVLAVAARYVGTPYVYGGTTPRGFDCSGFTGYVYRQLGMHLPRTANQQMHATHRVSRSHARPGDLVFFVSGGHAYHVGIYAGGGKMYDSPRTG